MKRVSFWVLISVTLIVYGVIVLWSLPTISAMAAGLTPFDMRPTGYSYLEASQFLSALSEAGAWHYVVIQHGLDWLYPPLISATLLFAIAGLLRVRMGRWRWVAALVAIPSAVFDYAENRAVSEMLKVGSDGLSAALVEHASSMTILKSQATSIAMILLLILLLAQGLRAARTTFGSAVTW